MFRILLIINIFAFIPVTTFSQVQFVDIVPGSGIDEYQGKSFGSSWGDINGDGLMDLFISNHYNTISLVSAIEYPFVFLNNGDNTFTRFVFEIDLDDTNDLHGGLFVDFDNDNDTDLLIMTGGTKGNLFFVNDGNAGFTLQNRSVDFNINQEFGRGRMGGCIDIDKNGVVDIILNNLDNEDGISPPSIYTRTSGQPFEESNTIHGFEEYRTEYSTLVDLDNDGISDLFMLAEQVKLFDINSGTFQPLNSFFYNRMQDAIIGDLTGNLLPDIYIARGADAAEIIQYDSNQLRSVLVLGGGLPSREIRFNTLDSIKIDIIPRTPATSSGYIHLGSSFTQFSPQLLSFKLDPNDPLLSGFQDLDPALSGWQVSFGKDQTGKFVIRSGSSSSNRRISLTITGNDQITNVEADPIPFNSNDNKDIVLINQGNNNFVASNDPVFQFTDNSRSVVIADFDNDMDQDIYVVCSTTAINRPNFLLENVGNGQFIRHDNAWGASGSIAGMGDAVSVVDYNNDGFLDLFVGNGYSVYYLDDAPYHLFKNEGNSNNWLKVILKGTSSPIGSYGSVAYLYTGNVAQSLTQNAGEHSRCQNDTRLNFGLGQNLQADSLVIIWPCGTIQKLFDINANQIIEVVEPVCSLGTIDVETSVLSVRVYPNPAKSFFYVECDHPDVASIRVVNSLGQVIDFHEVSLIAKEGTFQFKTPEVTGIYIVELADRNLKIIGRRKLVVD